MLRVNKLNKSIKIKNMSIFNLEKRESYILNMIKKFRKSCTKNRVEGG